MHEAWPNPTVYREGLNRILPLDRHDLDLGRRREQEPRNKDCEQE